MGNCFWSLSAGPYPVIDSETKQFHVQKVTRVINPLLFLHQCTFTILIPREHIKVNGKTVTLFGVSALLSTKSECIVLTRLQCAFLDKFVFLFGKITFKVSFLNGPKVSEI